MVRRTVLVSRNHTITRDEGLAKAVELLGQRWQHLQTAVGDVVSWSSCTKRRKQRIGKLFRRAAPSNRVCMCVRACAWVYMCLLSSAATTTSVTTTIAHFNVCCLSACDVPFVGDDGIDEARNAGMQAPIRDGVLCRRTTTSQVTVDTL